MGSGALKYLPGTKKKGTTLSVRNVWRAHPSNEDGISKIQQLFRDNFDIIPPSPLENFGSHTSEKSRRHTISQTVNGFAVRYERDRKPRLAYGSPSPPPSPPPLPIPLTRPFFDSSVITGIPDAHPTGNEKPICKSVNSCNGFGTEQMPKHWVHKPDTSRHACVTRSSTQPGIQPAIEHRRGIESLRPNKDADNVVGSPFPQQPTKLNAHPNPTGIKAHLSCGRGAHVP